MTLIEWVSSVTLFCFLILKAGRRKSYAHSSLRALRRWACPLSTLGILSMFLFEATLRGHYPKVWLEYKCQGVP